MIFLSLLHLLRIIENQSLKQENQILEVREKLELDNMRDMMKALEQNRIQVHDMRHHMIILREYALKKEYEAIETYLTPNHDESAMWWS